MCAVVFAVRSKSPQPTLCITGAVGKKLSGWAPLTRDRAKSEEASSEDKGKRKSESDI